MNLRKNSFVVLVAFTGLLGLAACDHDQQPANNPSGGSTQEPYRDQYGNTYQARPGPLYPY